MKRLFCLLMILTLATPVLAQRFYLIDGSGRRHGPYHFKQDATVLIDKTIYTLAKDLTKEQQIVDRLKSTVIPEINLRNADLRDVLDFLQNTSREMDPAKKGVNLVLMPLPKPKRATDDPFRAGGPAPSGYRSVTLSARYISLYDALNVVCDLAGLSWEYRNSVVTIGPKPPAKQPAK